jgi:hypothetical protein
MVTSDQSRGFLLGRMCSGVAPHLSDGSSAIGTVFAKSKKSSWLVTPTEYRSEWRTHYSTINRRTDGGREVTLAAFQKFTHQSFLPPLQQAPLRLRKIDKENETPEMAWAHETFQNSALKLSCLRPNTQAIANGTHLAPHCPLS